MGDFVWDQLYPIRCHQQEQHLKRLSTASLAKTMSIKFFKRGSSSHKKKNTNAGEKESESCYTEKLKPLAKQWKSSRGGFCIYDRIPLKKTKSAALYFVSNALLSLCHRTLTCYSSPVTEFCSKVSQSSRSIRRVRLHRKEGGNDPFCLFFLTSRQKSTVKNFVPAFPT